MNERPELERKNLEKSWLTCFLPPHPLRFMCLRCGYEWKREEPLLTDEQWLDGVLRLTEEHGSCKPSPAYNPQGKDF